MAKPKQAYVCTDCGADYSKWQGQCHNCLEWNTLKSITVSGSRRQKIKPAGYTTGAQEVTTLDKVDLTASPRVVTGIDELDRVLGGGFVPGSAVLIGGSPGAGKSTLLLQVMALLAGKFAALYVSGEESVQQIGLRARRLDLPLDRLQVMTETEVEVICATAQANSPRLLVVDSIQVMSTSDVDASPGGVTQVRESAARLIRYAKQTNTILILVGHVTKEGNLAGPRVLEHMIDCFLMLEGENDSRYRTLRSSKNRFGAVNELGIFAMTDKGLKQVKNPSAIFLSGTSESLAGSVVMATWEGTRPLLVEVQALVDQCALGHPRRVAVGYDINRLSMLLAVLHRHAGYDLSDQDVFVNAVGGVRITETSSDLAITLAIISSLTDKPLPRGLVVFGEVGLSGEIRPVPSGQERLRELQKHGFRSAIVPRDNAPRNKDPSLDLVAVSTLAQALDAVRGFS